MNIYVKFEIPAKIDDFLKELFSVPYQSTYFLVSTVETYHDKECKIVQCTIEKQRSIDDLYDIVTTYFPDITPTELLHELLILKVYDRNNNLLKPYLYNCSSIRRIKLLYYNQYAWCTISISQYDSKWSWAELLNPLGITTDKEIKEYVERHHNQQITSN